MRISTDKTRLDVEGIHDFLSNRSYWAKGRSLPDVQKTIEHSICFGAYDDADRQIGFARVVTDRVVFAYVMDVFVLEEHRRRGVGRRLVEAIVSHPDLRAVNRMLLATLDMHDLYRSAGFSALGKSEYYMERQNSTSIPE